MCNDAGEPDWWRLAASMRVLARLDAARLRPLRQKAESKAEACLALSSSELGVGGAGAGLPSDAERGAVSGAIEVLGHLVSAGDDRFVARAATWLRNGDWVVRGSAVAALGRVGCCHHDRVAELLAAAVQDDPEVSVRVSAARAVAEAMQPPSGLDCVLFDVPSAARAAAAVVQQVGKAMQFDQDPWVRIWAREALSGCVRIAAIPASGGDDAERARGAVVASAAVLACEGLGEARAAAREALEHAGLLSVRGAGQRAAGGGGGGAFAARETLRAAAAEALAAIVRSPDSTAMAPSTRCEPTRPSEPDCSAPPAAQAPARRAEAARLLRADLLPSLESPLAAISQGLLLARLLLHPDVTEARQPLLPCPHAPTACPTGCMPLCAQDGLTAGLHALRL